MALSQDGGVALIKGKKMETYSSEVSYIIRQDFLRFSSEARPTRHKVTDEQKKIARDKRLAEGIEAIRREMTHDDGTGGLGRYKSPIF